MGLDEMRRDQIRSNEMRQDGTTPKSHTAPSPSPSPSPLSLQNHPHTASVLASPAAPLSATEWNSLRHWLDSAFGWRYLVFGWSIAGGRGDVA